MRKLITLVTTIAAMTACTVKPTAVPPVAGPSELALGLTLQAVPDSILQDGASQAVITIDAHGANNTPVRSLPLRAELIVGGVIQDFGTLSAKTTVTGDDGKARITYTSPPAQSIGVKTSTIVTVSIQPIGGDYRGEVRRYVDIRLVPQGIIGPSNPGLKADFTFSPATPTSFTAVNFDGSLSTDNGAACGASCSYSWNFGDGSNGSGLTISHQFRSVGTFLVTLTLTDARGATTTTSKSVTVGAGTPPTASFKFSPTTPALSQDVFFTADESKAAAGRTIASYGWTFGDGATGSGVSITHRFDTPGTYAVVLTVIDDAEQKATAQQSVPVGGAGTGPTADLTYSPTAGITTATNVFFDATASTGPTPIVNWEFNYGDGTIENSAVGRQSHKFSAAGTYLVRVTITDTAGRKATKTASVTVS